MSSMTRKSPVNVGAVLKYYKEVNEACAGNPEKVEQFVNHMKMFRCRKLDDEAVIERVNSLFEGHTSLIRGFLKFLPGKSCDAVAYVDRVKSEFADQPSVYAQFLEIFTRDFKVRPECLVEAVERLAVLFADRRHLMEGFLAFLPMGFDVKYNAVNDGHEEICIVTPTGESKRLTKSNGEFIPQKEA